MACAMNTFSLWEDSMSHNDRSGQSAGSQVNKPVTPATSVKTPDPKSNPADRKFGAGPVKKEGDNKKK
jgi:hypothetical protein